VCNAARGGVDVVPRAQVLTGEGNWPRHTGSFTCRLPKDLVPSMVAFDGPPMVSLPASHALTADGKVRVVPLPGHTPGHVGLAVTDVATQARLKAAFSSPSVTVLPAHDPSVFKRLKDSRRADAQPR
jgi:hypothetical protein